MSFKVKSRKKILSDARVTLDAKHNEKLDYFSNLKDSVPEMEKNLSILNNKLRIIQAKNKKDLVDDDYEQIMDLKDNIKELENNILSVKNNKEDIDYLLNTGHLLFNYYNKQ